MKRIASFLICWAFFLFQASAADHTKDDDDVRETAIRFVLTHFEPVDLTKLSGIYITIDGRDPSDKFLERFVKHQSPVFKKSRSRGVVAAGSLSCGASNLKWISDDEAEIAAYREGTIKMVSF